MNAECTITGLNFFSYNQSFRDHSTYMYSLSSLSLSR